MTEPNIVYTDDVEVGDVIKHPVAGRVENAKITIYQSGGKKKSKMANFTGQNFESVKAELEEKYKQVTVNYIENDKPKGEIVEQIPTPDQMVIEAEQELKIG